MTQVAGPELVFDCSASFFTGFQGELRQPGPFLFVDRFRAREALTRVDYRPDWEESSFLTNLMIFKNPLDPYR